MTYTVTVYQSGNSNVITIPTALGVKKGDQFLLRKLKNEFVLSKIELTKEEKLKKLQRYFGSTPGLSKGIETPKKLEVFLEGIYE